MAEDVHISALDADPPAMIYNAMFQMQTWTAGHTAFLLRTSRAGQDLFSEVQQQVWSIDKELPLYNSTTLATLVSDSLAQRRFTMLLLAAFSAVALLLAAIGLFGVISYLVSQHQRDMALRMALGADRGDIHRMVLMRGARLGLAGCAIGLALSLVGVAPADHQSVSRQPLRSGNADLGARAAVGGRSAGGLSPCAARSVGRSDAGAEGGVRSCISSCESYV